MNINYIFKNMTIKRRFTVSTLTVTIFAMLLFGFISTIGLIKKVDSNFSYKIETTSKLVALSFVDSIWNLNTTGIKEAADALCQDNEIAYIKIEGQGCGEIYSEYKTNTIYDKENLSVKKVDVLRDNLKIGEITIGLTHYYKTKEIQNHIIEMILQNLIMVFILYLAINIVSQVVTKSIDELSSGTDEIAKGNLTHILDIDSGDEIGELANKFNLMSKNLNNMIQERDKAINELGASEEKFNKAFHYSADVIAIVRLKDKLYIEINEAFLRNFGYKREEIIGHYSSEFNLWVNEEQRTKIWKKLDGCQLLRNEEATWYTKNRNIRMGLFSSEIIEITGVPCIIFVWNDITERMKIKEELRNANDELENKVNERTKQLLETLMELEKQHETLKLTQTKLIHSEKMASIGTLVAGVAHEINNPINYTYLSSRTLQKDLDSFKKKLMYLLDENDEDVIEFFEESFDGFNDSINIILNGTNQIKTIVQDLRLFSRIDKSVKSEMSISEALTTAIRLVKTQYIKQISFITDFHSERKIECYPSQLEQVFLNIIVNACQAITKKKSETDDNEMGIVKISIFDDNNEMIVIFQDNGCGMNEKEKSRVFEPFFTTKPIGEGTGLGMAISYGIIEEHKGKIEVKSEEGKGTIITVVLPYDKRFT